MSWAMNISCLLSMAPSSRGPWRRKTQRKTFRLLLLATSTSTKQQKYEKLRLCVIEAWTKISEIFLLSLIATSFASNTKSEATAKRNSREEKRKRHVALLWSGPGSTSFREESQTIEYNWSDLRVGFLLCPGWCFLENSFYVLTGQINFLKGLAAAFGKDLPTINCPAEPSCLLFPSSLGRYIMTD